MIWREKRVLLIVLTLILLANVVFFFTYRVQYQSRLDELDTRLDQAQAQLDVAKKSRLKAESTLTGFRNVEKDVALVYDQYWSTEGARLTEMIGEVKHLAVASNLVPESYAFDRREAVGSEDTASARRREGDVGAIEVGVRFGVSGTYEQARRLINLLELSQQFVIIDQISLATAEGDQLSLSLHLKTLFRDVAANTQTAPKNRS
jgi:hypothetical protein